MRIVEVRLSMQAALLEKITPNLRVVCVEDKENVLSLCFFYDKHPSEEEEELANIAYTEFVSDFPPPDYNTKFSIEVVPYPNTIPFFGTCVFFRYEPTSGYFRKEKSSISEDFK